MEWQAFLVVHVHVGVGFFIGARMPGGVRPKGLERINLEHLSREGETSKFIPLVNASPPKPLLPLYTLLSLSKERRERLYIHNKHNVFCVGAGIL